MPNIGQWQPGESGNPKGRPKKNRALSALLEIAGSATVEVDGKNISGKRLMAKLMWDIVKTGRCVLPNGVTYEVDGAGWFDVVKFIYAQVDGPPKQAHELTGADGGEIVIKVEYGDRD